MIVIVDYGLGNLRSIQNMCRKAGVEATISGDPDAIASADKVILPGVGAFDAGMQRLEASGLRPLLDRHVRELEKPVLGICLGMQLMTRRSDEGSRAGLGWMGAEVERMQVPSELRIPHMGWNDVRPTTSSAIFPDPDAPQRFYFLHSYMVRCDDPADVLGTTSYGDEYTSAFGRGNVYGVQFHPEKSHRYGMELLRSFATKA